MHTNISEAAKPLAESRVSAAATYKVTISMDVATVNTLQNNKFYLYAFKAVKSQGAGAPLVWLMTKNYSTKTEVSWNEQYEAYTSNTEIKAGAHIIASHSEEIEPGQTLVVDNESGTGSVKNEGTPKVISIRNDVQKHFTCGIRQQAAGGPATMLCAFPLFAGNLNQIVPLQKVLLMFATQTEKTDTVLYNALSSGVLVDLTKEKERQVSYNMTTKWSWGGGNWAKEVPPNSQLTPLLIET